MEEQAIGQVIHYFSRLGVAGVELSDALDAGDVIHVCGTTTDFYQRATSIEIDRQQVTHAGPGSCVGLMVLGRVRPGDLVFRVAGPDRLRALETLDTQEAELGQ